MSTSIITPVQSTLACLFGIGAMVLCLGNAMRLMQQYGAPCRLLSSTSEQRSIQAVVLGFWLSLPLVFMGLTLPIGIADMTQWPAMPMACGFGWLVFFMPITIVKQNQFLNNRYGVYKEANQLILEGKYAALLKNSPEWQHKHQYYGLAQMPAEGCLETTHSSSLNSPI